MLMFNTALLLVLQVLKVQSQCDFQTEMLCGDECIYHHQSCQCGSQTMSFELSTQKHKLWTHVCCNTQPCQNATCPDGIVQDNSKPCNGLCPIRAMFGDNKGSFLCEDFNVCRSESTMCRGIKMCGLDPE